jgi:glycosyltransferase involved in cell wall biosynthesis
LDETIKKYSLEANWTFITKKLCIDDLVDYYNKCDLYVQPSIEEGFCLTFLEASSCGKPVIGTNTGAMPDLIRFIGQTNGCFPGDSDCLANTVIQVASQPRNFQDSQKQHQIIISKYSWSSVTKQLLEFYHKQITQTN